MQSQILPSRAALVDRIAMQFEYGQSLITLVGPSGVGKSYLAETLLTDKYPDFNKAYVKLTATSAELDVIRQLLEHSFRSPIIDQKLSLSENFRLLYSEQPSGPCLWVIDGARHLTQELAEELSKIAQFGLETVYILVTAQQPNLIPNSLDIHIEPLSIVESKRLMSMFFSTLPPDEDPIFKTFLNESSGNPSILLSWQSESEKLELRDESDSLRVKAQWQWYAILGCVLLSLFMAAFLYQEDLSQLLSTQPESSENIATVIPATQVFDDKTANTKVTKVTIPEEPVTETSKGVSAEEPESEASQSAEVAGVNTILNVITAETKSAEPESIPRSDGAAVFATEPFQANTETIITQQEEQSQVTSEQADPVPVATPSALAAVVDNTWFLAQRDEDWTIQLLAVRDVSIAQDFIAQYSQLELHMFQVIRGGQKLYIVCFGAFANGNLANEAKSTLPKAILENQPFLKQLNKIKQEITDSLGN
ncbi:AAA family ATPase [Pseudoalteromonas sp. T1lg65]|uniref:AAA family ATPase n=1 Tax=Pseudoalteromonas sp. T1lg65 TaxID=2077101 RepID=UPI003F79E6AF